MSEKCATVTIKADNDYGQKVINLSDLHPDDEVIDDSVPKASPVPEVTSDELINEAVELGIEVPADATPDDIRVMIDIALGEDSK